MQALLCQLAFAEGGRIKIVSSATFAPLIRQVALFRGLSPTTLDQLGVNHVIRSVEEGSFFFQQGDACRHLYVLAQGRVKITQITADGQQVVLRLIMPGQTFGSIAVLRPESDYPASALAMEDSTALAWDSAFLRGLAQREPSLNLNLMDLMRIHIEEMQARFREVATEKVEQRLAQTLLRLAAQTGKRQPDGHVTIDLRLTRQDLAEMIGTTLYSVSRLLSSWERRGLISTGRESVAVLNPHGLVSIAEDLDRKE
jgi:CRP-like cAMP-binding protein